MRPAPELARVAGIVDFPATPMKCLCCRDHFIADPRNEHHQEFCTKPECRQASKRQSQQRWLAKPENQNYFHGPSHADRVRAWRQKHPGYWKNRKKKSPRTLQEVCPAQPSEDKLFEPSNPQDLFRSTLQDVCRVQAPLLVGLISQLIDSPLQEDIVGFLRRVVAKGQDLLDMPSRSSRKPKDTHHDSKETASSGSTTAGAPALQLDRSPAHSSASAP